MELLKTLESVCDQETFLIFAKTLLKDRITVAKNNQSAQSSVISDWENDSIEDYLESAIAWVEDTHFGKTQQLNEKNLWKLFAHFLCAGKAYE